MAHKIELLSEAEKDYERLDRAVRKEVAEKIDTLADNPFLGNPLGNKFGMDLTGFYKLYAAGKRYRIVYRLAGGRVEVVETVGIGKREKQEIYKLVAKRLKKLRRR
jgi:mRNA interferase RelE/StbE